YARARFGFPGRGDRNDAGRIDCPDRTDSDCISRGRRRRNGYLYVSADLQDAGDRQPETVEECLPAEHAEWRRCMPKVLRDAAYSAGNLRAALRSTLPTLHGLTLLSSAFPVASLPPLGAIFFLLRQRPGRTEAQLILK